MVISAIGRDEGQTVRALKTAYDGSDVARVKIKRPYKAHRVALGVRGPNTGRVRHSRGKSWLADYVNSIRRGIGYQVESSSRRSEERVVYLRHAISGGQRNLQNRLIIGIGMTDNQDLRVTLTIQKKVSLRE